MRRLNEALPEHLNSLPKVDRGPFTVLGASGFIGGRLVRYLRSLGHSVLVPGRDDAHLTGQPLGHLIYAIGVTADFRARPFDTMDAHVSVLSKALRERPVPGEEK